MTLLVAGLALFILVHSLRPLAPAWRMRTIARIGEGAWKGVYSVLSVASLVLLVQGFRAARLEVPVVLWSPPAWTHHLTALLVLLAFVMAACSVVPGTRLKERIGHPLLLGTKTWALAHLLSNGTLMDVVLFGAFLAWAVAVFVVSRRRDRAEGVLYAPGRWSQDVIAWVAGTALWALFAFWLHAELIGIAPLG